tara:strand:+ start:3630 stop:3851 length:222 start_codon:yes stop_codon:yes gene_type:complete
MNVTCGGAKRRINGDGVPALDLSLFSGLGEVAPLASLARRYPRIGFTLRPARQGAGPGKLFASVYRLGVSSGA